MCDYCSWIKTALEKGKIKKNFEETTKSQIEPVIVIHGGAGKIPKSEREFMLQEVKNAAKDAYEKLIKGADAIDAVVQAISHMESKKYFNCAKGGSHDINGDVVMDAAIMNNNFQAGCVGAVRDIEHPIDLAKAVLEKTDHILLVEDGAQRFAISVGIPLLPPGSLFFCEAPPPSISSQEFKDFGAEEEYEEFDNRSSRIDKNVMEKSLSSEITQRKLAQCVARKLSNEEEERKKLEAEEPINLSVSAVGAIAYDRERKFVCGTSTAGNRGKIVGSISSIGTVIGCGIFADQFGCASVSGEDTTIYAYAPARKIVESLKKNASTESSLSEQIDSFEKETNESNVGAIALNAAGEPAVFFKSMHFPWAICQNGRIYYGCAKGEKFSEKITTLEKSLNCMCKKKK